MHHATQTLPPGYSQSAEVNLKKDKRLIILLNIAAFFFFILIFYLAAGFTALVRPSIVTFSGNITIGLLITTLGLTVVMLILHEAIHGFFFWLFSHSRPVFALRPLYAYAGAPAWFFPRRQYAITALGPLVIIGAAGLLTLLLAPGSWVLMTAFLAAMNTGGSVGDLFVLIRLSKLSAASLTNDTGEVVTFFEQLQPVL